ncbi:MAG: MoxR family ATPase [Bdellovibrionaceae bacterium]|nr:MoxR family ATPase [Pseudobdellovibrionaceae bacterium]
MNNNDENCTINTEWIPVLFQELSKLIVGQKEMLEAILMGVLSEGHVLIEGLPGLAKTLSISTFSKTLSLAFQRIQFTPDLLPSDIIGTMIFNPNTGDFNVKKGPVFSNIVLADEINRASAKVQSALLEAMAEKQVSIGSKTYPLETPFLVLATQNPIEQEGTFELPEAQLDRFLFKVKVNYPSKEEELQILEKINDFQSIDIQPILSQQKLLEARKQVREIHIDENLKKYIVDLVMTTRSLKEYGLKKLEHLVKVGVSPRATLGIATAAKAQAFLKGRNYVNLDDIKVVAYLVLRHRLILTYEAEAENINTDSIITEILANTNI